MRRLLGITVLLEVLLLVASCSNAPPPPAASTPPPAAAAAAKGDAANGKTLFGKSCVACHGPDAKGVKGLGKDLTTSTFVKGKTDAEMVEFVKKGRDTSDPLNTTHVAMPPKGGNPTLTDQQLTDVVAYMRSLQK